MRAVTGGIQRALSSGARSARVEGDMFPLFRAGVIESNDLFVVAAETEDSVVDAGAAQPRMERERESERESQSMFPVIQAVGGVIESNTQLVIAAETKEAQSVLDASAAQQHTSEDRMLGSSSDAAPAAGGLP
ncbi:hypothetical protein T484DRAFT_1749334 [Baffinella frigidus]|nr:hypothetical protein T484DRAFT_1749334 [Cryptophyta sp. CCMP2293]